LAGGAFVTWFKIMVLTIIYMQKNQLDGIDRRITNLSFGHVISKSYEQRLGQCIGRDLVDAWSGLVSQDQSAYFRREKSA
jgi:tetrahydromethanopterin S-methyltransferase subunit G